MIEYMYSGQADSIGLEIQYWAGSKSSSKGSIKDVPETRCSKYKKSKNQWSLVLLLLLLLVLI